MDRKPNWTLVNLLYILHHNFTTSCVSSMFDNEGSMGKKLNKRTDQQDCNE